MAIVFLGMVGNLLCPVPSNSSETMRTDFLQLQHTVHQHIIGQEALVEAMLLCLLADGHILLEGMPGLAKTTAVKTLADGIEGDFHRIQFTPDLLPSDVVGTDIYLHDKGDFRFRKGPIFHHILLADEINRAPAKVQSALLEGMAEKQVTVGAKTYVLPALFMVLATQNPIEQEGTYGLPEAQRDRFMLHVRVPYPTPEQELKVLQQDSGKKESGQAKAAGNKIPEKTILEAREAVRKVHMDPKLEQYIVDLVQASRNPSIFNKELGRWCRHGASPRATLALARCARAKAWLEGEEHVLPHHIQKLAPDVLRHRVILSFEAEAEGISPDDYIRKLLNVVAVR